MFFVDYVQLQFIHPTLRRVMDDIEKRYGEKTITSLYRIGDDGVHGTLPLRGCDLRARKTVEALRIVEWVNQYWIYDPDRPHLTVAMAHGKESNFHIHLQVNNATVERT